MQNYPPLLQQAFLLEEKHDRQIDLLILPFETHLIGKTSETLTKNIQEEKVA